MIAKKVSIGGKLKSRRKDLILRWCGGKVKRVGPEMRNSSLCFNLQFLSRGGQPIQGQLGV